MKTTTITEDYVSFEIAKLLREKGFDIYCPTAYETMTSEHHVEEAAFSGWGKLGQVKRPTLQMAMKWLREAKGIAIVPILSSVLDNEKFLWDIEIIVAKTNETYYQGWVYESYERACEAAIKYCLENLINT